MNESFDLMSTNVFLEDGGKGTVVPLTDSFWPELISGNYKSEETRLFGEGSGWMLGAYEMTEDMQHWEMHPSGDEFLVCVAGSYDVILDLPDGEKIAALPAGNTCKVPQGVWHRQEVREPGRIVSITFGRGTEHRPR
jgi:mannose-6-phosphate isomerase-like protein (cupin superfamily)